MAKNFVRIGDGEDTAFIMEVVSAGGEADVTGGSLAVDQVRAAISRLQPLFEAVKSAAMAAAPSKSSIEVGLSFKWEAGKLVSLVLAGSAQASVKVSMEWSRAKE